jgi:hypothetical protein
VTLEECVEALELRFVEAEDATVTVNQPHAPLAPDPIATVVTKDCGESRRQDDAKDRETSGGRYRSGRDERSLPREGHSHALQPDQEEERCVAGKLADGQGTPQSDASKVSSGGISRMR